MGGEPGAPLFADALRAMAARPADTIPGPYELGPDLYQSLLRAISSPRCFAQISGARVP
jgi:hypothetical protein